jgi:RHS repeat-associated protein
MPENGGQFTPILGGQFAWIFHHPFGMQLVGRKYTQLNSEYKYGFQTQEKVNEIAGEGNHYIAQFWEYDPRIGRRWNLDPVDQISISNYAALGNNPIYYTDFLGDRITPKSDWTEDGRKGGRYSLLNLFLVNAMMGEDDDPNNRSGRNCSMCCLNALNSLCVFFAPFFALRSRAGIKKSHSKSGF